MAGLTPQSEKRAAIEATVLRATEQLLAGGASYAELNIERIASAAGISRTAFYFYFRDKRELLMRLTEGITEELYAAADAWWSGSGDPAREIEGALGQVAALYRQHGALLRAIVEVSAYDEEVARFWRGIVQRFVDATRERIEREQASGRAVQAPPLATALALTWMSERTLYQHLVQELSVEHEELVAAMAGIWTRAVYGER